jgi:hypothetical protein
LKIGLRPRSSGARGVGVRVGVVTFYRGRSGPRLTSTFFRNFFSYQKWSIRENSKNGFALKIFAQKWKYLVDNLKNLAYIEKKNTKNGHAKENLTKN